MADIRCQVTARFELAVVESRRTRDRTDALELLSFAMRAIMPLIAFRVELGIEDHIVNDIRLALVGADIGS